MGFSLSDIKQIYETEVDDIRSSEVEREISVLLENVDTFRFDEISIEDQAIVYAIPGYIARNIIKNMPTCQDCSECLSPGKVPLQLYFEQPDTSTDETNAKEEFVRSVTRGGLIKPSDALYVLCAHVYMMYTFIINDEQKKQVLLSASNPRSVFVETFIQKCEENENTCVILDSKCVKGHCMKPFMVKGVFTMFNIFAKNLTSERNTEIHKKRKRVNISDAKKTASARKLKKLTSN